jgi:hypothetical protein
VGGTVHGMVFDCSWACDDDTVYGHYMVLFMNMS